MTATAPLAHAALEIAAAPDAVYAAWIEPLLVMHWMFAPEEPAVYARNEPFVGGHFAYCVSRGGQTVDHVGSFLELERPSRLVFTWGVGKAVEARSQVTVSIRAKGGARSLCSIDHAAAPGARRDGRPVRALVGQDARAPGSALHLARVCLPQRCDSLRRRSVTDCVPRHCGTQPAWDSVYTKFVDPTLLQSRG